MLETPQRIEPALIDDAVPTVVLELAAELAKASARQEVRLSSSTNY